MKIHILVVALLLTANSALAGDSAKSLSPVDKALIQFAFSGDLTDARAARSKGASVEATDSKGRTALMWAAANGHTPVVEFLLGEGADINAVDSDNQTALMYATTGSFVPTVEFLLANGAEVNFQSKKGRFTALTIAASGGNLEIVQLLLEHGADKSLAEGSGSTPLDRARQNGHSAVVALLQELPAPESDPQ